MTLCCLEWIITIAGVSKLIYKHVYMYMLIHKSKFIKGQTVNILDLQPQGHGAAKAAMDNTQMNGRTCIPVKLCVKNQAVMGLAMAMASSLLTTDLQKSKP